MAKAQPQLVDENDLPNKKHPLYDDLKEFREDVRAVIAGVKALLADTDCYLPQGDGETDGSYELRTKTATCNKYLAKAVKVMSGMVFQKEIDLTDVPADIQKICENINKEGDHLNTVAQQVFEEAVLIDGYGAILTDTPSAKPKNKAVQGAYDSNPFVRFYCADSIWNYTHRVNPNSKAKELSMITFQEITQEKAGRFGMVEVIRYRVYELTDTGGVTLQTWTQPDAESNPIPDGPPIPINTTGIPVEIAGKLGCPPPLYDVAKKNIEHFQTYSLLKSDAHKTMVPQRVIEGGSADSIAPIAGDVTLFPPPGMKAYFIEVEGKSLEFVRSLCKDIAADIAMMTSAIISGQPTGVNPAQTATEVVIDSASETAELRPMAEGYKGTWENVLDWIAELMNKGKDAGGSIVLGTAWAIAEQKAEEAKAQQAVSDQANVDLLKAKANGGNNG